MDKRLEELSKQIELCTRCPLRQNATQPVPGIGEGKKYMIIGEAPGAQEDKAGIPFIGAAGKRLNQLLELAGIDLSQCYITNVCKCLPPKVSGKRRAPRKAERLSCYGYLKKEIEIVRPEYIITLGATPLSLFSDYGVTQMHGTQFKYEMELESCGSSLSKTPTVQVGDSGSNPTLPLQKIERIDSRKANEMLSRHYLGAKETGIIAAYSDGEAVAVFSNPVGRKVNESLGLKLIELVRLYSPDNWDKPLSKFVSVCLKLAKKDFPEIDGIYSLADPWGGHVGTIYQATNFVYLGETVKDGHPIIYIDGKSIHPKTLYGRHGTQGIPAMKKIYGSRMATEEKPLKHKYLFPFSEDARIKAEELKKPYPRKQVEEAKLEKFETTIIAMYHPAAALHQPRLWAVLLDDFAHLPEVVPHSYVVKPTASVVKSTAPMIALDTETDNQGGLGQWSIAYRNPEGQLEVQAAYGQTKLIYPPDQKVVFHNAKYDIRELARNKMPCPKLENVLDTMIMAYCLGLGRQKPADTGKEGDNLVGGLGLKYLARRHLGMEMKTWQEVKDHPEQTEEYNANDSIATFLLAEKWIPQLPQHFWDIDMPMLDVLMKMEDRGIKVDPDFIKKYAEEIDVHLDEVKKELGDLNPYATEQVADYIYGTLGYPVTQKTSTGKPQVTKEILETIDDPIVRRILEYKGFYQEKKTYISNYVKGMDLDNRVHCEFKQTSTSTGRLSAARPNLQNVVKEKTDKSKSKIRDLFIAEDGMLLVRVDWQQLELRVFAALTQDEHMLKALLSGQDIHQMTADMLGVNRDDAKINNFLTLYGGTAWAISREFHIPIDKAKRFQKDYYDKFPGVEKYMAQQRELAETEKKVYNHYGRVCRLDGMFSNEWKVREDAIRLGINMPIQGCLPADTKILTPYGWQKLEQAPNQLVVWTGETWAQATKLQRGKANRVRLFLSDGRTFDCDNRHYLLVQDSVYPRWEHVSKLNEQTPLVRDTETHWGQETAEEEDWYWIGRFIGDGWLGKSGWSVSFGHESDELAAASRLENWLSSKVISGKTHNSRLGFYRQEDARSNIKIRGNTQAGRQLWISFGVKEGWRSRSKRIPEIVFTLDRKRRQAFFDGYFDADGYEGQRSRKLSSVNRSLLEDTLRLMQTLGITGKITEVRNHGNQWFDLSIHKSAHPLVVERIEILPEEEMFTLSVNSERHSFSTEGIISKNTAGEIVKLAMIDLHYRHEARMLLQIHDELIFELPAGDAKDYALWLKEYLPTLTQINDIEFPVDASVGRTWLEASRKENKV